MTKGMDARSFRLRAVQGTSWTLSLGWYRRMGQVLRVGALVPVAMFLTAIILAVVGPRMLGFSTFVVYSGSMEPAIRAGSVAVAKPTPPEALKVGDVVAYRTPGSDGLPIIHRVVSVADSDGARVFAFKGDANQTADPINVTLEGSGGRVLYSVSEVGRLLAITRTGAGRVLLVWLPILTLLLMFLWSIWAPDIWKSKGNAGARR